MGLMQVKHIESGKAVSRALRSHFLVQSALTTKLLVHVLPVKRDDDCNDDDENNRENQNKVEIRGYSISDEDLQKLETLAEQMLTEQTELSDPDDILTKVTSLLKGFRGANTCLAYIV